MTYDEKLEALTVHFLWTSGVPHEKAHAEAVSVLDMLNATDDRTFFDDCFRVAKFVAACAFVVLVWAFPGCARLDDGFADAGAASVVAGRIIAGDEAKPAPRRAAHPASRGPNVGASTWNDAPAVRP